MKNQNK